METRSTRKTSQKRKAQSNLRLTLPADAALPPSQTGLKMPAFVPWVALLALALLAYLPALRAGFIWDDDALTNNHQVLSPGGLWQIWTAPLEWFAEQHYWPLTYSTFWLEHQLWGLHPLGYHLTNILLHGLCCVLLWRILRRLEVPGAWLAAALFAVHPIHAESVAWIIERKDVLSGALYLGAALAYLKFDASWSDSAQRPHRTHKTYMAYCFAMALFTLAMLSKSIAVSLPPVLAVALWWRHGKLTRRDLAALAPLALLAIALTALDLHVLRLHAQIESGRHEMGSGLALSERLRMAPGALWAYLFKLAWPYPLATVYPTWQVSGAAPLAWVPLLSLIGLTLGLWAARGRIGRGPLAALAFFGITLAPVLGIVDFEYLHYSWVADRFVYLASAGPLALAAAALFKCGMHPTFRIPHSAFCTALLLALGTLCLRQAARYRDSETLFKATLAAYPDHWASNYLYGWALLYSGRDQEVAPYLHKARQLAPRPDANIMFCLALCHQHLNQPEEAEKYFIESLKLNPKFAAVHHNYGAFLSAQGRYVEAFAQAREALRLQPGEPDTLNNLGTILLRQQKFAEAEGYLRQAVARIPGNAEYHNNLAAALASQEKYQEALREYEITRQLNPGLPAPPKAMGTILLKLGRPREAAAQLEQALQLQPQAPAVHFNLAAACEQLGDPAQAIAHYREALRGDPSLSQAADRIRALGGSTGEL